MMTPQRRAHLERLSKFREARIAEAAWHWNRQYPYHERQRCKELGISDEEINEGFELGEQMLQEYHINCATHGDPSYGSWGVFGKPPAQPIRNLILTWLQGPSCATCGGLAPVDGAMCCPVDQFDREISLLLAAGGTSEMLAEPKHCKLLAEMTGEAA